MTMEYGYSTRFVLQHVMVRRRDISSQAAIRIPMLGAMIPNPLISLVVTDVMARREETNNPASVLTPATPVPPAGGNAPPASDFRQVPDVTTMPSFERSKAVIEKAGLVAVEESVPQNDVPVRPKRAVFGQKPAAGEFVPAGSTVIVFTSAGVAVPSVINMKLEEAVALFPTSLWEIKYTPSTEEGGVLNTVVSQKPSGGEFTDAATPDGKAVIELFFVPVPKALLDAMTASIGSTAVGSSPAVPAGSATPAGAASGPVASVPSAPPAPATGSGPVRGFGVAASGGASTPVAASGGRARVAGGASARARTPTPGAAAPAAIRSVGTPAVGGASAPAASSASAPAAGGAGSGGPSSGSTPATGGPSAGGGPTTTTP